MIFSRRGVLVAFALLFQCIAGNARVSAQQPAQASIDKANRFIGQSTTARYVLGYAHFGANYSSHQMDSVRYVKDEFGTSVPGKFALVYRYRWDANGAGNTNLAFICDRDGNVERVEVLGTDAILHQPFLAADATTQTLGAVLIEAFKENLSPAELRLARRMVENADSQGLLGLGLRVQQSLGK